MELCASYAQSNVACVAEIDVRQMLMMLTVYLRHSLSKVLSLLQISKNVFSHYFSAAMRFIETLSAIYGITCLTLPCSRYVAFNALFIVDRILCSKIN